MGGREGNGWFKGRGVLVREGSRGRQRKGTVGKEGNGWERNRERKMGVENSIY